MRIPFRSIATLLMAVGVATCSDAPTALVGTHPVPRRAIGRLGFEPQFSKSAQAVYAQRDEFGIHFDSVHVVIRGYPDTTVIVKDTTVFFSDTSSVLTLNLDVPVQTDNQRFNAALNYQNGNQVVFSGSGIVQSHPADKPAPEQQTITINYAGPGATVTNIAIAPKAASIRADEATAFTLSTTDVNGKPATAPPINWSVSNPALATLANTSNTGATVVGRGISGTVTVTATSVSGLTDNATVTLTSPPAGIILVSGGGQTGKVGSALSQPAVVRVVAQDGGGVPGVTVIFSAPAGGSVGTTSTVTDGAGNASTSLKLGTAIGTQGFAATALGFSVGISETATAGSPAAISVVSGDAQTDTVGHTLKAPLVVKVADSFGNPVSGATVSWSRTGNGTLSAATSATGTDGTASVGYTLGKTTGSDEIDASINGVTASAKFTETAVAGSASKIEVVSGDKQTAAAGKQLAAPFVVKVSDAAGNLVSGATVTWSASAGTITASTSTDSKGVSQNTLTLGKTVGDVTVTASVSAGKSVTFTATAIPGPAAAMAFGSQPANTAAGSTMSEVTVTITDAFGNLTNASGSVTLALGNNPGKATLSGTLTHDVVNGIATFNDLKLDKPGTGYTLVANGGGLTATSNAFNVTVGTPANLQVVGSTSLNLVAGTSGALPKLLVTDVVGNGVAGATIHFVLARGSPAVTLADTNLTTDATGSFDLNQYIPQVTTAAVYTLTASVTGAQGSPATITATVTPATATKVVFQTWPASGTAGGGLSPQPQVAIIDAFGNIVTSATDAVTLAIQAGTGTSGAALSGTTTVHAVSGVATFTDLSIDKAGAGYCLEATSGTLTKSCTPPFPVNTGAPSKLLIQQQPTGGTAGGSIGSINVAVADANGNILTNATNSITLALTSNPGGGTLTGTLTQTAVNGIANFGGLSIDKAGNGYVITASATGLASVATNAFNMTASGATQLVLSPASPTTFTIQAGTTPATAPVIKALDASGNPAGRVPVHFVVDTGSSHTTVSAVDTATDASGVLAFVGSMPTVVGVFHITATSSSIPAASVTATVGITPGPAAKIAFVVPPGTSNYSGKAGASITLPTVAVAVEDQFGNIVTSQPATNVTVALGTNPASGTLTGTLTQATVTNTGIAVFTDLKIDKAAIGYTLTASANGFATATSLPVNISSGAASKLAFTVQPSNATAGATIAPPISVQVQDQFGNVVGGATNQVTLSIASGTTGATLTGNVESANNGNATFSSAKIDLTGTYTLTAAASGLTSVTSNSFAVTASSASSIQLAAGSPSSASITAGGTIASPPSVVVKDGSGNPVVGASVTLSVKQGSTVLHTRSTSTDATGTASFSALTTSDLPTASGSYTIEATSGALGPVTVGLSVSAGAPSTIKLVPSNTAPPAGAEIAVVAEAADAFGNVATDNATRTIAWSISSGTAASTSPTTMNNGISSFLITTSSSPITVTATDQANALSQGTATVTPSAAGMTLTQTSTLASSATVNTSVGAPAAKLTTSGGAPVSGVMIKFTVASGGGKLVFGSPVDAVTKQTDASGVASGITAWNMGTTAGSLNDTLTITAPGTNDVITDAATATPGTPTSVVVGAVPGTIATNTSLGSITVTLKDAFGNVATNASGSVTLTLSGGTTTTLTGTTSRAVSNGVATFSDISVPTAGTGYVLTATFGALSGTSASFNVTGGTATHLAFVQQPSSVTSLSAMSPAVTVEVLDINNARVTTSTAGVKLKLHTPAGAVLTGDTANAVNGLATFSNLQVDLAGTYTLDASSTGLTGATSNSFTVTAGAPAALSLSHGGGVDAPSSVPDDSSFASNSSSGPKVQVVDASGNPVSISNITVNADVETDNVSSSAPGPSESGMMFFAPAITTTSAVTNSNGLADFSGAKLRGAVGGLKIHFTATYNGVTLTEVRTSHVNLTHGRGRTMTHEVSLPSWVTPGHKLSMQPKVQLLDIDGNTVDGASIHLSFDPSGGGGDALGGSSTADITTDANGEATVPAWTVGNAGFHTLWADLSTDNSVRADATVNSAAAHHISLSRTTLTGLKNGDSIPSIDATVVDASGHAFEDTTFTVSATANSHSGKLINTNSRHSSNTNAKASFGDLTVDAEAQTGATLDFSVDGLSGVTASITFDIAAGTESQLDRVGSSDTLHVTTDHNFPSGQATVAVKDHNKRNGLSKSNVQVTWSLGGTCTGVNITGTNPSLTGSNGQADMPAFTVLVGFTNGCTVTAHAVDGSTDLGSYVFTLVTP